MGIIETQAKLVGREIAVVMNPRDHGYVGRERFGLNGRSIMAARVYSLATEGRVSSVRWRAGMVIPRGHHISRHGNKR